MINTKSAFFYGFNVTNENKYFEFSEGIINYFFYIPTKSYLPDELALEISRLLNETGTNDYVVLFNRSTLGFDISSSDIFSLQVTSGIYFDFSIFPLIGYETDKTGLDNYISDLETGIIYRPQCKLQSYIPFGMYQKIAESTQKKLPNGSVEIISYGRESYMECDFSYITNRDIANNTHIERNLTGVEDAISFMEYATEKLKIEFWEDRNYNENYVGCILEKTNSESNGTGFKLSEMYDKGLVEFYTLGKLTFREV